MPPPMNHLGTLVPSDGGDGLGAAAADPLPCCPPGDDTELEGVPQRAIDAVASVAAEILDATTEIEATITELFTSVSNELGGMNALINSMADEQIGAVDLVVSDLETKLVKIVAAQFGQADREIEQCIQWLLSVDVNVPWHPAEMAAALKGDWFSMVTNAVPAIADHLYGDTTTTIDQSVTQGDVWNVAGDSSVVVGDTTNNTTSNVTNNRFDGDTYNVSPLVPPPPPAEETTTTVECPSPAGPITVNVTVPVPTLNSPPTAPPPPPAPDRPGQVPPRFVPPNPFAVPPGQAIPNTNNTGPTFVLPTAPPVVPAAPVVIQGRDGRDGSKGDTGATGEKGEKGDDGTPIPPNFPGQKQSALAHPVLTQIDKVSGPDGIDWNRTDACKKAKLAAEMKPQAQEVKPGTVQQRNLFRAIDAYSPVPGLGAGAEAMGKEGDKFWGIEGTKWMADRWDQILGADTEAKEMFLGPMFTRIAQTQLSPTSTANPTAALYYAARVGLAAKAESLSGMPMTYLYTGDRYMLQYSNPQDLPNQIRVDDAFLGGTIDEDVWVCWTRANGNQPEPARRVLMAQQVRPDIQDLILLWRRGHMNEPTLFARCRERGVLDPAYVREWQETSKALPHQPDLIRFMVRDASDNAVAEKYGYDTDFEKKYTGQIKAWAKGLGLDEEFFRYSWRSHWEIPSYTQLAEMFHRLRPDRPALREWERTAAVVGETGAKAALGDRPPVVTREDMREALKINDVAPGWVEAQIEVSYTPINRTDAIRAYQIGAFDEARLRDAFLDVGYSPTDSDTLVKYHSQDKARKRANITGTWSVRKITTYYKRGYIGREKAEELMTPLTADRAEVKRVLDAADDELAADTRAAAVKGVRRGLMSGEHSDEEATKLLTRFGVAPIVAERMVATWVMERDTRYKRISAAQAQKMLQQGLISAEELRRRIRNLGYAIRDADLITAKALHVEGAADGLQPAELDTAIGEAIKSRKQAERVGEGRLASRLRLLWNEAERIVKELNRRREGTDKPKLPTPPPMP